MEEHNYREKRRARREKMVAEVYYVDEKNHSFGGCVAVDISETGVRIRMGNFIAVGTRLNLEFKLPLTETAFYIKGKVMWINKTPYNEQWEAGVKMSVDPYFVRLVQKYINTQQEQGSEPLSEDHPSDLEN